MTPYMHDGMFFILVEGGTLILAENCKAHFINNYATNTGGGIFISNTRKFISTKTVLESLEDRPIILYYYFNSNINLLFSNSNMHTNV